MHRFSTAARRARIGRRHHLARSCRAADVVTATRDMVVLHATDPVTVHLSAWARTEAGRSPLADGTSRLEAALYDDRRLIRMLGMRRTLFIVPTELGPVVQAAATRDVAARMRRGLLKDLASGPLDPPLTGVASEWLAELEEATVQALLARGAATANELAKDVPLLRTAVLPTTDKTWDVRANITSRVLVLLAAEGRIGRDRPGGTWRSTQYRWAPATRWWPDGLPELDPGQARQELARRWLSTFGPAPAADLQWWTGWTKGQTTATLAGLATAEVELDDGGTALVLADDLDDLGEPSPERWVALLPALDPTPMGWQRRDWYLGEHRPLLFDTNGNVGPTVWADGRIIGGWGQRPHGEVVHRVLEDVGRETLAAVERSAAELQEQLDGAVVTPRFRTPLERELSR